MKKITIAMLVLVCMSISYQHVLAQGAAEAYPQRPMGPIGGGG